jgi:hypothetical protein
MNTLAFLFTIGITFYCEMRRQMSKVRPFCITILYHNLLLFIDIFHI